MFAINTDTASPRHSTTLQVHADEAVAEHYVLNNHVRFRILYHKASTDADTHLHTEEMADDDHHYMRGNLIVGFTASPYSIAHTFAGE